MSDIPTLHSLLAAAPLDAEWGESEDVPLAALPCWRGVDLAGRTAFVGDL
jgi:hypothetical protein